jgi:hypothetical protein
MHDESDSHDPRVEALIRQSRWIPISRSEWFVDDIGLTKGNRTKAVASPLNAAARPVAQTAWYFWKESLTRYPLEFWSEILAYQIAPSCGIPVGATWPAQLDFGSGDVRFGSLASFLVDWNDFDRPEVLIEGGDFLSMVYPEYRRKRGEDHSIQLCYFVFQALNPESAFSYFHALVRQLVFDALIGNSDRHQDNWAFGVKPSDNRTAAFRLVSAFDNGTSFGRELSDERLAEMLKDQSQLDRYILRGRAHMRWEIGGRGVENRGIQRWIPGTTERLNHETLLQKSFGEWPELQDEIQKVLNFDAAQIGASISRVAALSREPICPENLAITPVREKFLVRSVLRRRDRLRQVLFDP